MKHLFIILMALLSIATASAQKATEKSVEGMYAFGYAATPTDSVVYLTEIHKLPTVKLTKKGKFLVRRAEYSAQLKAYVQTIGVQHPACAIIFHKNEKKLMKKFTKIVNKAAKNNSVFIKTISAEDFTFKQLPEDDE